MSPQIAGLAPATLVASRKLGPTSGRCSASSLSAVAACVTRTLATTCGRWLIVAIRRSCVSASIACGRAPGLGDRALDAVVEHPAGRGRRRQVPAGALEEVRSGVLHARGLRSGEGMSADEAAVRAERGDHVALHRADVGDRAILARGVERLRGEAGERDHRCGAEDQLGALDRRRDGSRAPSRLRRAPPRGRAAPGRGRIRRPRRRAWRERRARSTLRSDRRRGRRFASAQLSRPRAASAPPRQAGRASAPSCPSPCRRR